MPDILKTTEPELTSAPLSKNDLGNKIISNIRHYWLGIVIVIIIGLLGYIYYFAVGQFESNVTIDHAEHSRTSPSVHEIVHVRQLLQVGVNADYAPLSYKVDGELVGFEIDLARAIASELNVPVKFVEDDFRDAFSVENLAQNNALTEDKVDIVIAGLATTRSREELFAFSNPYLESGQVAITKSNASISTLADLSGKVVGVEIGSSGQQLAASFGTFSETKLYSTPEQVISAVARGEVAAFIADAPNAKALLEPHPGLHIATDLLTHEEYAVAVMRNEDDLTNEVDTIIEDLRQRGVLESLRQKWLE